MNELKQVFLKDGFGDVIYINDMGKAFLLAEAVGLDHSGTYDQIVAFPGFLKAEDGLLFFEYNCEGVPVWFYGAVYFCDVCGKGDDRDEALKSCKEMLDGK